MYRHVDPDRTGSILPVNRQPRKNLSRSEYLDSSVNSKVGVDYGKSLMLSLICFLFMTLTFRRPY